MFSYMFEFLINIPNFDFSFVRKFFYEKFLSYYPKCSGQIIRYYAKLYEAKCAQNIFTFFSLKIFVASISYIYIYIIYARSMNTEKEISSSKFVEDDK